MNALKTHLIILLLSLCVSTAGAQSQTRLFGIRNASVEKFEWEAFGGLALQLGESESGSKKAGWNAGAEVRYNFAQRPIDLGLRFAHTATQASFITYKINSIMVVSDWNFLRGSTFDPFAGVGVGINLPSDFHNGCKFTFMPRVGWEFNDWLRLTATAQVCSKYLHNFQVSLGFVLGGRKAIDPQQYIADMRPAAQKEIASGEQEPASEDALRLAALMKDERKYRSRAKTYGILGGVSLGVGAVLTTSGIIAIAGNKNGNPAADFGGIILTSTGGLFALGSVPLFIVSHNQSVKAASISAFIKPLVSPGTVTSPGIGLSLTF